MKCYSRSLFTLFLALVLVTGLREEAHAIGFWHRDYMSALNEAKAEHKNLLIVFTGTDWIEICTKFYDEILGEPAFIEAVSKDFALLKLEYPKDNHLPQAEMAEKALLRDAYQVRGFPTVVLTDVEGRPFGINGYQALSPVEYAEQLTAIAAMRNDNLIASRGDGTLQGPERAKELSRAIPDLPRGLIPRFYRNEMEAVLEADPEDTLKLRDSFLKLIAEDDFGKQMLSLGKDSKWGEMIDLTNRFLSEQGVTGTEKQGLLINRASIERRAERLESSLATLKEAIAIDPESEPGLEAARILQRLEQN